MKNKTILGWMAAGLVAAGTGTAPFAVAQEEGQPTPRLEKADQNQKAFSGKVDGVNQSANTFTVAGTTYHVTAKTKVTRGGKAINFSDVKAGEPVSGMCRMSADGNKEALTVNVGEAASNPPKT